MSPAPSVSSRTRSPNAGCSVATVRVGLSLLHLVSSLDCSSFPHRMLHVGRPAHTPSPPAPINSSGSSSGQGQCYSHVTPGRTLTQSGALYARTTHGQGQAAHGSPTSRKLASECGRFIPVSVRQRAVCSTVLITRPGLSEHSSLAAAGGRARSRHSSAE